MARGGARPGAGRKAGKNPNTSPLSARARPRASRGRKSKAVAGRQGRAVGDRSADPVCQNARTHTDAQVAAIAASIKEWGWTTPALVGEDGGLIAGHARILAARQLGIAEIPVMVAAGWSEAQKRAYVLADNQLAITGSGWDPELLRLELGELQLSGFDLSLTGFGDLELKDLLAERTEGLTDPDDAPAAPEHPVSQTGDLWMLGRHRLLCGDSTVATDVGRVLGGVDPHLMVTDPPYGVEYDPAWRNRAAADGTIGQKHASRAIGQVVNDDRADWREGSVTRRFRTLVEVGWRREFRHIADVRPVEHIVGDVPMHTTGPSLLMRLGGPKRSRLRIKRLEPQAPQPDRYVDQAPSSSASSAFASLRSGVSKPSVNQP
jgi:hypothetical protein